MKSAKSFPTTKHRSIEIPIQIIDPVPSNIFEDQYVGSCEGFEYAQIHEEFLQTFIPLNATTEPYPLAPRNTNKEVQKKNKIPYVADLIESNKSLKRDHDDETPVGFMKKRHASDYGYKNDDSCPAWEQPEIWENFCLEIEKENLDNSKKFR